MRRGPFVLTLALACGCGNGLAPLEGDIYVLRSIAGVSLPAPFVPNPIEGNRLVADTIALAANGTGERRTLQDGGVPGEPSRHRTELTYTRTAHRIDINFVCRDTGDCIGGPHLSGTITNAGITIDQSTVYAVKPFVYTRLFPPD
jgi:hypothetical protein